MAIFLVVLTEFCGLKYLRYCCFLLLEVDGQTAWTATKSTGLVSQYAIAVMHSNLWPGAHAFAVDK